MGEDQPLRLLIDGMKPERLRCKIDITKIKEMRFATDDSEVRGQCTHRFRVLQRRANHQSIWCLPANVVISADLAAWLEQAGVRRLS